MCERVRLLTLTEVRRRLRLSVEQATALVESGALPAFRVLGEWRVEPDAFDAFLDGCYQRDDSISVVDPPAPARGSNLTRQQSAILDLLANGLSNAEIAERLVVEVSTVKTHVSKLLQRFDLRDREQLIAYVWRTGLAERVPDLVRPG
jgi:DNA-binding CsgD family transcriptional regulator